MLWRPLTIWAAKSKIMYFKLLEEKIFIKNFNLLLWIEAHFVSYEEMSLAYPIWHKQGNQID